MVTVVGFDGLLVEKQGNEERGRAVEKMGRMTGKSFFLLFVYFATLISFHFHIFGSIIILFCCTLL